MKSKFNSDDDLPLKKPLKFHLMTVTIRSVFEEDGKLYPQVFLDDSLYELSTQNINCKQRTCLKDTSRKSTYKNPRIRKN